MKQVSAAYRSDMNQLLRNRSFVEIAFDNIDTTAATDGAWSSNGATSYSSIDTLDYTYAYTETCATLELNRWGLDGTSVIPQAVSTVHDGFVSNILSDASGVLSTPTILTRSFSHSHVFPGITLTFDTRTREWPMNVTVTFYSGDTVEKSVTMPVTQASVAIDAKVMECDKIVISVSTTLPYRRVRLEQVLYGIQMRFGNDDIISTLQTHDVDPLCRRLPQETMQFTLLDYAHNYDPDNPSGGYEYLDKNAPVSIRFGYQLSSGAIEWLKADRYRLSGKPSAAKNQATFTGTGLIGSLTGTFYKSKLGNKNFYDMAEEVLLDAGLTLTPQGDHPWDIDASLKTMYTTAALPIDSHMNCLQLIAHACRCRLFTDDDNIIHIERFGVTKSGIYSGTWSDNGHQASSEWLTIDRGNQSGTTYATLELNRWALGGNDQIVIDPASYTGKGYIGSSLSDVTGSYATNPAVVKTFSVPHDLPVLTIQFDEVCHEYPNEIVVRYYNGNTLLDTQTVSNPTSSNIVVNSDRAIDCTKIEIAFVTSLPYRYARISKVAYRETAFTLDFTSIGDDAITLSKIDQLKSVSVAKYSYVPETNTKTLYTGTTTDTKLHVEFSEFAQNVQVSVSGGSLVNSEIYASAVDLSLTTGTKTITITGTPLSENSVVVSYSVNLDGEVDKEENPLITNDAMCNALANHIKQYLQMRNTYQISYRGNPELEAGDIIGLQTLYTDNIDALILVDEIKFNGAVSGKVKVKGLI